MKRVTPKRTCDKAYKNYSSFKPYLEKDFNGRCGYCDITEIVIGKVFQIDHFAPRQKFPDLECEYSNLVYTCPSCNRAKWNDWPMSEPAPSHDESRGYVDPCDAEYATHLNRTNCGIVEANTPVGVYMRYKLNLFALKHRYLWLLDIAHHQCEEIGDFLQRLDEDSPEVATLKEKFGELCMHYFNYHKLGREHS